MIYRPIDFKNDIAAAIESAPRAIRHFVNNTYLPSLEDYDKWAPFLLVQNDNLDGDNATMLCSSVAIISPDGHGGVICEGNMLLYSNGAEFDYFRSEDLSLATSLGLPKGGYRATDTAWGDHWFDRITDAYKKHFFNDDEDDLTHIGDHSLKHITRDVVDISRRYSGILKDNLTHAVKKENLSFHAGLDWVKPFRNRLAGAIFHRINGPRAELLAQATPHLLDRLIKEPKTPLLYYNLAKVGEGEKEWNRRFDFLQHDGYRQFVNIYGLDPLSTKMLNEVGKGAEPVNVIAENLGVSAATARKAVNSQLPTFYKCRLSSDTISGTPLLYWITQQLDGVDPKQWPSSGHPWSDREWETLYRITECLNYFQKQLPMTPSTAIQLLVERNEDLLKAEADMLRLHVGEWRQVMGPYTPEAIRVHGSYWTKSLDAKGNMLSFKTRRSMEQYLIPAYAKLKAMTPEESSAYFHALLGDPKPAKQLTPLSYGKPKSPHVA